jgi:hypothetical protein
MDNQTRVPRSECHHRHFTWIDAMMQQALSCEILQSLVFEPGEHAITLDFSQS